MHPRAHGFTVAWLRRLHGGTVREFAEAAGVHPNVLTAYENFQYRPRRPRLEHLARAAGVEMPLVDEQLALTSRALEARGEPAHAVTEEEGEDDLPAEVGRAVAEALRPALARRAGGEEGRALAEAVVESLRDLPLAERAALLAWSPDAHQPAVLGRLCEESVRAAPDDPEEAFAWAELALSLVPRLPGDSRLHALLEAHARAVLGNAWRVSSDLPAAEREFLRSEELWRAGAGAGPFPLDASRRLDLKASLRRDQRRFAEAHELLDEALKAATPGDSSGRVLLNKAAVYDQEGARELALTTLEAAADDLSDRSDERLLWVLHQNLAAAFCRFERFEEAERLLPKVRRLAEKLGNALDLARVRWLEACVARGLGRREEALEGLEQVRREFAKRRIAYDAALVSLEIAALRLERGETAEVRRLAEEMLWIFEAQGIAREALASLRLFFEAARREVATAEMARAAVGALQGGKGGTG